MRRLRLWKELVAIAAFLWAVPLGRSPAVAQQSDPLTINGTFVMQSSGTVGADLAAISARGETHTWTMTLHGLSYDNYYEDFSVPDDVYFRYVTRVHATSFDFEFQGPDADALNAIVSPQLEMGALSFEIRQVVLTNYDWGGLFEAGDWWIEIDPIATWQGLHFVSAPAGLEQPFSVDENGYPVIEPRLSVDAWALILDDRPGNDGTVGQYQGNVVAFDAPLPPPPPPPPPPTLSILDASVREGNRGTTWLDVTVMLSRYPDDLVTVNYQTADGTASSKSDYTSATGTLLFWPDEVSHVISIAIKTDRKREQDETFTVRLSNAVGATIADGVATATILNDD